MGCKDLETPNLLIARKFRKSCGQNNFWLRPPSAYVFCYSRDNRLFLHLNLDPYHV